MMLIPRVKMLSITPVSYKEYERWFIRKFGYMAHWTYCGVPYLDEALALREERPDIKILEILTFDEYQENYFDIIDKKNMK